MPVLNSDILREVLIESIKYDASDNLEKFMLSGKRQFHIALRFFSNCKWLEFHNNHLHVGIYDDQDYAFSYDYPLLKSLFKAFRYSIKHLYVRNVPADDFGYYMFKKLMKNDLTMFLYNVKLSKKYLKMLKAKKSLKEYHMLFPVTFSDLSFIPSTCQSITLNISFEEMSREIPKKSNSFCFPRMKSNKYVLPFVTEVHITATFVKEDITVKNMEGFAQFIANTFPNLKVLTTSFSASKCSWIEMFTVAEIFHPSLNLFQAIPSTVDGYISFVVDTDRDFLQGINLVYHIPPGQHSVIAKLFPLNNNFEFEYILVYEPQVLPDIVPVHLSNNLIDSDSHGSSDEGDISGNDESSDTESVATDEYDDEVFYDS